MGSVLLRNNVTVSTNKTWPAIGHKNKKPTAMPKRKITPVRVLAEEAPDAIEGHTMISLACILYMAVYFC